MAAAVKSVETHVNKGKNGHRHRGYFIPRRNRIASLRWI